MITLNTAADLAAVAERALRLHVAEMDEVITENRQEILAGYRTARLANDLVQPSARDHLLHAMFPSAYAGDVVAITWLHSHLDKPHGRLIHWFGVTTASGYKTVLPGIGLRAPRN